MTSRPPVQVTLFSKPGCHLCEEARDILARLRARYPHDLETRDIRADPALFERYRHSIPVVVVAGREYAAPLTWPRLESALREATR